MAVGMSGLTDRRQRWPGGGRRRGCGGDGGARVAAEQSCDDLLLPSREVHGQKVGPASCAMQDADISYEGTAYKRVDVGLDGTVDGFAAKVGDYKDYFTNSPDLVFPQTWGPRQVLFGVATYERAKGASMNIVYPADAARWNGRIFVTVHGRGRSFKEGNLKPWDKNFNPSTPLGDLDRYERLMVSKGYAVVKTNRTASEGLGEIKATLEDGTVVDSVAFNDIGALHHGLHRGGARAAPQAPRPRAGAYLHVRPFGGRPHRPRPQLHARAQRRARRQALLRRPAARRSRRGHVVSGGDEGRQGRAADERRRQGRVRAADRRRPPDVQQHLAAGAPRLDVVQLSREQAQQRAHPARPRASPTTGCTKCAAPATPAASRCPTACSAATCRTSTSRS